jgi:hypothetical protein
MRLKKSAVRILEARKLRHPIASEGIGFTTACYKRWGTPRMKPPTTLPRIVSVTASLIPDECVSLTTSSPQTLESTLVAGRHKRSEISFVGGR